MRNKKLIKIIEDLKAELIIKSFYKGLEKAPTHLLMEYWKHPLEPTFKTLETKIAAEKKLKAKEKRERKKL